MKDELKEEAGRLIDLATDKLDPKLAADVMGHVAQSAVYESRAVEATNQQQAEQYRRAALAERGSAQDILAKEARDRGDLIAEGLWSIALAVLTGRRPQL